MAAKLIARLRSWVPKRRRKCLLKLDLLAWLTFLRVLRQHLNAIFGVLTHSVLCAKRLVVHRGVWVRALECQVQRLRGRLMKEIC